MHPVISLTRQNSQTLKSSAFHQIPHQNCNQWMQESLPLSNVTIANTNSVMLSMPLMLGKVHTKSINFKQCNGRVKHGSTSTSQFLLIVGDIPPCSLIQQIQFPLLTLSLTTLMKNSSRHTTNFFKPLKFNLQCQSVISSTHPTKSKAMSY